LQTLAAFDKSQLVLTLRSFDDKRLCLLIYRCSWLYSRNQYCISSKRGTGSITLFWMILSHWTRIITYNFGTEVLFAFEMQPLYSWAQCGGGHGGRVPSTILGGGT